MNATSLDGGITWTNFTPERPTSQRRCRVRRSPANEVPRWVRESRLPVDTSEANQRALDVHEGLVAEMQTESLSGLHALR
jgi:hypothetical protein